ncbi:MAG: hypothetical protein JWP92_3416 [Caulobacter sp.]|nr:hypothetical protein [Caulobacter sp.]
MRHASPVPIFLGVAMATALTSCATLAPARCPAGQSPGRQVELLFGRNIGDKLGVSDNDFRQFLDAELTPRFPDGLTVLDAAGQWRSPTGQAVREPSKLVILALPGRAGGEAKIDAARAAYNQRFAQEAVLVITHPVCLGF